MSRIIKRSGRAELSDLPFGTVKPIDLAQINAPPAPAGDHPDLPVSPEDVLARARQEADVIIRTAHAEAEAIHDNACARGRREGLEAGVREAAQAADDLIRRLEADLTAVEADRDALADAIEPQALKLCMEAVEKIVRHEARTDTRVVLRVIRSCLRRVKDSSEVYLRVNPEEIAEVRAQRDELLGLAEGVRTINIVDDRRVSRGGCIVESPSGDFDARIETQLDRLDDKLMETLENDRQQTCPGSDQIHPGDQQN